MIQAHASCSYFVQITSKKNTQEKKLPRTLSPNLVASLLTGNYTICSPTHWTLISSGWGKTTSCLHLMIIGTGSSVTKHMWLQNVTLCDCAPVQHHLQQFQCHPVPIDFAWQKPAVKVTKSNHVIIEHCNHHNCKLVSRHPNCDHVPPGMLQCHDYYKDPS